MTEIKIPESPMHYRVALSTEQNRVGAAHSLLHSILEGAILARETEVLGVFRGIDIARRRFQKVWGDQQTFLREGYGDILANDDVFQKIPDIAQLHPRDILPYARERLGDDYLLKNIHYSSFFEKILGKGTS